MNMKKKKAKNGTHTPSTQTQRHTQRQTHEHRNTGSRAVGRVTCATGDFSFDSLPDSIPSVVVLPMKFCRPRKQE